MTALRLLMLCTISLLPGPAWSCWEEIGLKYNISPDLLYAIAKTESDLNPVAVNRSNKDGSYDIGLMQINSRWLPTLARFGITESQLLQPCVAIEVGAWILSDNQRRLGATWGAVGAYNAADPTRRLSYARKVYKNLPPPLRSDPPQCSSAACEPQ